MQANPFMPYSDELKKLMQTILPYVGLLAALYLLLCIIVYVIQDRLIFFPEKLTANHQYHFFGRFREKNIKAKDGIVLNGLLYEVNSPKGIVLFVHGNAGSIDTWGWVAETYTNLNYDCFVFDFRGFGKSEGNISSEQQFYDDVQAAYDFLKTGYAESDIVVIGFSIGSAAAARIASQNQPRMLILQAPYFSLVDMAKKHYPFLPSLLLKYKFRTWEFLQSTAAPVVIFHGEADEIIYYGSSVKLKTYLKRGDKFIPLKKQSHNGIHENKDYIDALKTIL